MKCSHLEIFYDYLDPAYFICPLCKKCALPNYLKVEPNKFVVDVGKIPIHQNRKPAINNHGLSFEFICPCNLLKPESYISYHISEDLYIKYIIDHELIYNIQIYPNKLIATHHKGKIVEEGHQLLTLLEQISSGELILRLQEQLYLDILL